MKALALTQPWASLVACGAKQVETRTWSTKHRGPLLIYAAKRLPGGKGELAAICAEPAFQAALVDPVLGKYELPFGSRGWLGAMIADKLPRGKFVAVADLEQVVGTSDVRDLLEQEGDLASIDFGRGPGQQARVGAGPHELAFGNYTSGRFAWMLTEVRAIKPTGVPKRAVTCFQGLFDVPEGLAADMIATAP